MHIPGTKASGDSEQFSETRTLCVCVCVPGSWGRKSVEAQTGKYLESDSGVF